jgi:hypothetical protein
MKKVPETENDDINIIRGGRVAPRVVMIEGLFRLISESGKILWREKFIPDKRKLPKGVTFCKHTGKFRAQIREGGKVKSLGYFDNPEKAEAAYATHLDRRATHERKFIEHAGKFIEHERNMTSINECFDFLK